MPTRLQSSSMPSLMASSPPLVKLTTGKGNKGIRRLEGFKHTVGWRGDSAEQQETITTGASLLLWSVLANDLPVVQELLRTQPMQAQPIQAQPMQAQPMQAQPMQVQPMLIHDSANINRTIRASRPELCVWSKMTPLMAGMAFARWEIVELLLDAGARHTVRDSVGNDAFMQAAVFGRTDNIRHFLARFPCYNLDRRNKFGMSALAATLLYGTNAFATVKVLVKAAAPLPALALHFAAANPNTDPEMVEWLLRYNDGQFLRKLNLRNMPRSNVWRAVHCTTRALAWCGTTNNLVETLAWQHGATPLHYAAAFGHFSTAAVLANAGARRDVKNAQGLLPECLGRKVFGGERGCVIETCISIKSRRVG